MLYKTINYVRYQQLEKWSLENKSIFFIQNIEEFMHNENLQTIEIGMTPEQWEQFEQQCPILTEKTL